MYHVCVHYVCQPPFKSDAELSLLPQGLVLLTSTIWLVTSGVVHRPTQQGPGQSPQQRYSAQQKTSATESHQAETLPCSQPRYPKTCIKSGHLPRCVHKKQPRPQGSGCLCLQPSRHWGTPARRVQWSGGKCMEHSKGTPAQEGSS